MDVTTTVMLSVYGASIVSILGFYHRRLEQRFDRIEAYLASVIECYDNKFERTDDRLHNHGERISTVEGRNLD
ncbi:MAG: hypothetical protein OXI18_12035 [bacterium]|nr:hypothetical protein [bacterium]